MFCYKTGRRFDNRSIDNSILEFIIFFPSLHFTLLSFYSYFILFLFFTSFCTTWEAGSVGWNAWLVGLLVGFVSWLISYLLAYLLACLNLNLNLNSKPGNGEQETDLIPFCTDAPLFALTFIGRFCLQFFVVVMRCVSFLDRLVFGAVVVLS